MRDARLQATAFVAGVLVTLVTLSPRRAIAQDEAPVAGRGRDDKWGRWAPADEGLLPLDLRVGLHVTHVSLRTSGVGDGARGADYGFDRPTVFVPEMIFAAFTARHLSLGVLLQPAGFGAQDMAATTTSGHSRSPFLLGAGLIVEGGWSAGPILFRPGIATGPRVVMLIEDRSGRQSPPAVAQWFIHGRLAAELALSRAFAFGVGGSTDALRPLDWGGFAYFAWRIHDVPGATN